MEDFNFPWAVALTAILLLLFLYALGMWYQRRKAIREGGHPVSHASAAPPSLPAPRFRQAISSWLPLLKDESKDSQKWEEVLIRSDMGPRLTRDLVSKLQKVEEQPQQFFRRELKELLRPATTSTKRWESHRPWVLFVVGVNGAGKTTTLVKLGAYFKRQGKSLGVVAADTFRKAAVEQLQRACEKNDLECFSIRRPDSSEGADPASVVFDGLKKFKDRDLILVDTSGRLHNQKNLMAELEKMKRVADKSLTGAPHDIWLVLDATLGQNAVQQAESFHASMGVTGLIVTKLDGLSRGGAIFQMAQSLQLPVFFVGVGEKIEDLEPFQPDEFVDELFDQGSSESLG